MEEKEDRRKAKPTVLGLSTVMAATREELEREIAGIRGDLDRLDDEVSSDLTMLAHGMDDMVGRLDGIVESTGGLPGEVDTLHELVERLTEEENTLFDDVHNRTATRIDDAFERIRGIESRMAALSGDTGDLRARADDTDRRFEDTRIAIELGGTDLSHAIAQWEEDKVGIMRIITELDAAVIGARAEVRELDAAYRRDSRVNMYRDMITAVISGITLGLLLTVIGGII